MWQNKIQLLWSSVESADPADPVCQFTDHQTLNIKTYADLRFDLSKLDFFFSGKENLKIVLLMEKSYYSLVSMLFCFFRGHTFLPIFHGSKNAQEIIDLIRPDHILTINDLKAIFQDPKPTKQFFPSKMRPEKTAYIISTSGTTGKPKLIPITYSNFAAYLDSIFPIVQTEDKFCLVQNFEITFDPYLFDLVSVIFNQSSLVPVAHSDLRKLGDILDSLPSDHIWISLTPSQADLVVTLLPANQWAKVTRTFLLGEKLKTTLCQDWLKFFPKSEIYNMYGPAEVTVSIFYHRYDSMADTGDYVPVGKIHPGHTFIVNDNDELIIEGPQVFGGYLGNPIPGGSFNTRDTAKVVDSHVYILGRSDFQTKINGRRFQPEEMELNLKASGFNGYIVPVTRQLDRKEKTHLVYVTQDSSVEISDILKVLQPRYDIDFIPKRILKVKHYPLSQNGKIDRHQLLDIVVNTESK